MTIASPAPYMAYYGKTSSTKPEVHNIATTTEEDRDTTTGNMQ